MTAAICTSPPACQADGHSLITFCLRLHLDGLALIGRSLLLARDLRTTAEADLDLELEDTLRR
jgi:hypothetical protein